MDRKGLEAESGGRESKGQERTGEPFGENQQKNRSGKTGDVKEGERQTQEKGGEAKGKGQLYLYL